ncbi:MAG: carbohydrate ABC transporter permease [Oscillospiraceae bacterium]|nr:carbohydrate ABC transporter permease [Oscillospiraceae bacterium]
MAKVKSNKIRDPLGDRLLQVGLGLFLLLFFIVEVYPLIYVVASSFSSANAITTNKVLLWPVEFTTSSYEFVFQYKQVWVGFRNSVFYTAAHVIIQISCTLLVAYPLSRRYFQSRRFVTFYFYLTTRFAAGMIPTFILKSQLGLYNNVWAVIFSGTTIAVTHMFMLRTAITSNVPEELFDSARIDGANHFQSMTTIAFPLVKSTIAVLCLYGMVESWNDYFTGMLYLREKELYPLQVVLRPIMTDASNGMDATGMDSAYANMANDAKEGLRYALIVITAIPPVVAYFILQKNFKGGVMMGSVKG